MIIYIGVAVGLIVAGLLVCWLSSSAGKAATAFWWIGFVLAAVGVLFLLAPIITYLDSQVRAALGVNR